MKRLKLDTKTRILAVSLLPSDIVRLTRLSGGQGKRSAYIRLLIDREWTKYIGEAK